MSRAGCVLTFLVPVFGCAAGCIAGTGRGDLTFSPDGTCVSHLEEDRLEEPWVDGKIWLRTIRLCWCRASDPARESSAAIAVLGAEFGGYVELPNLEVKWSPDSSRIGVLTPHKLVIVDIDSGRKAEIRDGRIMGFAWTPDDEVAYCARRTRGTAQRRVICRRSLVSDHSTEVVAFPEYPGRNLEMDFSWRTYWAPSGEYVIFLEPSPVGQYQCVNLSDGTHSAFGQADLADQFVAWAPDSGHAFCVSRKIGPEDHYEATLLEPATGKGLDCTSKFQEVLSGSEPNESSIWTPDGKYVLVNGLRTGGLLVHPHPWEVIPLGQIVAAKLRIESKPWLFPLPVAGWVGVLPTGNIGDSPVKYAVDYSGKQVHALGETGDDWAVSPDGTRIAVFGRDNHVVIRKLDIWRTGDSGIPKETPSPSPATRER